MKIGRPVLFKQRSVVAAVSERRYIVRKSVYPNVDYVFRIERNLYSPIERRSRYAYILKSRTQEVIEHFVLTALRLKEFRIFFDEFYEPVLIFAETEEIALLFHLRLRPKRFARFAIVALVFVLIYIALSIELFEYLLHRFFVIIVRSSYEFVVRNVEKPPEFPKFLYHFIYIFFNGYADALCDVVYLLTVFVRSSKVKYVIALHSLEPS